MIVPDVQEQFHIFRMTDSTVVTHSVRCLLQTPVSCLSQYAVTLFVEMSLKTGKQTDTRPAFRIRLQRSALLGAFRFARLPMTDACEKFSEESLTRLDSI